MKKLVTNVKETDKPEKTDIYLSNNTKCSMPIANTLRQSSNTNQWSFSKQSLFNYTPDWFYLSNGYSDLYWSSVALHFPYENIFLITCILVVSANWHDQKK